MLLVDDYTRMTTVLFLKNRSEAFDLIKETSRSTRKWLKMIWIQESNA
jgi:hypothetical protein